MNRTIKTLIYGIIVALAAVAFALSIVPLHELGHYLFAAMLGIGGTITVDLAEFTGCYYPNVTSLTHGQILFIEAGSFVFPAIVYGLALVPTIFLMKGGKSKWKKEQPKLSSSSAS